MASIYFYYNELLRQSADQTVTSGRNIRSGYSPCDDEDLQQQKPKPHATPDKSFDITQQGSSSNPAETKANGNENQDEDQAPKMLCGIHADIETTLVALQPRMNRLAYLQTTGATNLDALARSLGPKL